MQGIQQIVKKYAEHAVEIRRKLHQNPELGYEEIKTTALIRQELNDYGIEIQELPGLKTGLTAIIRGKKTGKTIGLREDIDALPMKEETKLPFASINNCAHACGHDIHCSTLLLTARVLQEMRDELAGNVRLFFQPAEERITGAQTMLEAGAMDLEPQCECAIGLHCSPDWKVGTIGLRSGAANASSDKIVITVKGKGGHGAHPEAFVDPIVASAYMLTQLQTVVSRENLPVQAAVLTFGTIHGGTAMNIVPSEVKLEGTLRALNEQGRHKMLGAIKRIAECSCAAMRAEAVVDISADDGVPALDNDATLIEKIRVAAQETIGKENINNIPNPSLGSEDFSRFGARIPVAQFRLGTSNDDPNTCIGLHSPYNIFDDAAIEIGATVMAQFALDYSK